MPAASRPLSPAAIFLAGLVLLGMLAAFLPEGTHYSGDTGANYLQARALIENGFRSEKLSLDASETGFNRRTFPLRWGDTPGEHRPLPSIAGADLGILLAGEDGLRIGYPIPFALLVALVISLTPALWWLIPAAGGALTAASTYGIAREIVPERAGVAAAAVLAGSPLLFYGLNLWGHAPATGLITLGVGLLVRDKGHTGAAAAAGLCFGLAGALRNEAMLLGAMLAAAAALHPGRHARGRLALLAAFVLPLIPGSLYNQAVYGHPFNPIQAARARELSQSVTPGASSAAGAPTWADRAIAGLRETYLTSETLEGPARRAVELALLACILLVAASLARAFPHIADPAARTGLFLGAHLAMLYALLAILLTPHRVAALLLVFPLALAAPLGLPILRRPDVPPGFRSSAWVILLYMVIIPLRGTAGLQWGPRYLLPAVPLLAVLALRGLEDLAARCSGRSRGRVALSSNLLLLAGFLMAGISFRELHQALWSHQTRVTAPAASRPGTPVAFDFWYLPWTNPTLVASNPLYFLVEEGDLISLATHLREEGKTTLLVIVREGVGRRALAALGRSGTPVQDLATHELAAGQTLSLHEVTLGPAGPPP